MLKPSLDGGFGVSTCLAHADRSRRRVLVVVAGGDLACCDVAIEGHEGAEDSAKERIRAFAAQPGTWPMDKLYACVEKILATGASYERQLRVADENGGDLRAVVRHLVTEFRDGPSLRDHLNALR